MTLASQLTPAYTNNSFTMSGDSTHLYNLGLKGPFKVIALLMGDSALSRPQNLDVSPLSLVLFGSDASSDSNTRPLGPASLSYHLPL